MPADFILQWDAQNGQLVGEDPATGNTVPIPIGSAEANNLQASELSPTQSFTRERTHKVVVQKISTSDGEVWVADGPSGELARNTDAATVIQSVIDNTSFESCHVTNSVALKPVILSRAFHLDFEYSSLITTEGTDATIQIQSSDCDVTNATFIGGGTSFAPCIKVFNPSNRIERINLHNITVSLGNDNGLGLRVENANNISVSNTTIAGTSSAGANFINVADLDLHKAYFITADRFHGARFSGCANVNIVGCIFDSSEVGAKFFNNQGLHIFGGISINNTNEGMQFNGQNLKTELYGHEFRNNSTGAVVDAASVSDVTFNGNFWRGNTNDSLKVIGGNRVRVIDPTFAGLAPNLQVGITTVVGAKGFQTENQGAATFDGDGATSSFSITHGLAEVPETVTVQPDLSTGATSVTGVTAVNNTSFDVVFDTAPPSGTGNVQVYWTAKMAEANRNR